MANEEETLTWAEKQETFSDRNSVLFDRHSGEEAAVFTSAMTVLYACFEEDLINRVEQTNLRVCAAMLSQPYQQLVSCWSELRCGRLLAASVHWRSIAEAPAFVLAAAEDANFALEWADTGQRKTVKPERARRLAKRRLNRMSNEAGSSWATNRSRDSRMYEPYSHFSPSAARLAFLDPDSGAEGLYSAPEGVYSPRVRAAAMHTAVLALDVVTLTYLALGSCMSEDWRASAHDAVVQGHVALKRLGAYA